jgi:hypothetical protein
MSFVSIDEFYLNIEFYLFALSKIYKLFQFYFKLQINFASIKIRFNYPFL